MINANCTGREFRCSEIGSILSTSIGTRRFTRFKNAVISHIEWWIQEEFEDTKGVIRIVKTDKTMTNIWRTKRTNNDLFIITQKTRDLVTRIPLKTGDELMCSGRVRSSCTTLLLWTLASLASLLGFNLILQSI